MTDSDFRDLVRRMRTRQRDYFRYRKTEDLVESKRLERAVDLELEQKGLFDSSGNPPT